MSDARGRLTSRCSLHLCIGTSPSSLLYATKRERQKRGKVRREEYHDRNVGSAKMSGVIRIHGRIPRVSASCTAMWECNEAREARRNLRQRCAINYKARTIYVKNKNERRKREEQLSGSIFLETTSLSEPSNF